MPFPVKNLLEKHHDLVCVKKDVSISNAFSLMIENDFSQLPVIDEEYYPLGMITHEQILRGLKNFESNMNSLYVRDVMANAPVFSMEDDLFDLLDKLKETNAVLIIDPIGELDGIVTSYDANEFFRRRTENIMRVEDIETIIKDFIRQAYTNTKGELDEQKILEVIKRTCPNYENLDSSKINLEMLTFGDYIHLLLFQDTWKILDPILQIPKESLRNLLENIRKIRNDLAHFRKEVTSDQQDQLHFCSVWFSKRQEAWDKIREKELRKKMLIELGFKPDSSSSITDQNNVKDLHENRNLSPSQDQFPLQQFGPQDSRYAPLADFLLSQPGKIDLIRKSFEDIEAIIEGDLPVSAHNHRAWWANDPISHSHAKSWVESGWRTSFVNMTEKMVTFVRIKEREKLYIDFFSSVLTQLSKYPEFPLKKVSPDGASWIITSTLPISGSALAYFNYSFTRDKQFRVELYLDLNDQEKTKKTFDRLKENQKKYEDQLGVLEWERIDQKRASRIALYHSGQILDSKEKLSSLQKWAVQNMIILYRNIAVDVTKVINEISLL